MLTMHFQQEYVRCGKAGCHCAGADATSRKNPRAPRGHGPYWYGYWKENGKLHKRYFGKRRPGQWRDPGPPRSERPSRHEVPDRFDWDGRRMSEVTAMRVLGLGPRWTPTSATKAFRKLVVKYHPDRARGSKQDAKWTRIMQAVNAAHERMRA